MFRPLLILLFLFASFQSFCQPFGNEWIHYSKTYYKFPIRATQLCRIPKATLVAANIGDIPAQNFQLWRNGKEVPIYTTQASGPLAIDGFIEFNGQQNDGKKENVLYLDPSFQPTDSRSLFSDTSWYYLTENVGNNARLIPTENNVASTKLLPDSFFNYSQNFINPISLSPGYAIGTGGSWDSVEQKYVFQTPFRSSAFDKGEGFIGPTFKNTAPYKLTLTNLKIYPTSPPLTLRYSISSNADFNRSALIYMNDSLLTTKVINGYDMVSDSIFNIPFSRIANDGSVLTFTSNLVDQYANADILYVNNVTISYQRTFNFNNSRRFTFGLKANNDGNNVRISNFNEGSLPPVLYDFTNGRRYIGVLKGDSSLFLLLPSTTDRELMISAVNSAALMLVPQLSSITFKDYSLPANQANYAIISNHRLYDSGHNYVEDYRAYRSSAKGGGYNAKIFDIDDLAGQFSFGQRKNPLAIKNFVRYLTAQSENNPQFVKPKYIFLIGKASVYQTSRGQTEAQELLNAVPTFGYPASDNLLASPDNYNSTPLIPIGRISVVDGKEISVYLEKVKQYEALAAAPFTPETKAWKREVVQSVGADPGDEFLSAVITNFMKRYETIITDTLIGAHAKTYVKLNNVNYATEALEVRDRVNNGVGLINYFGHGQAYNFDNPEYYTNTNGKYPVFIANGCKTGNVFDFTAARFTYFGIALPDRFLLYPNKGAIAFIAGSDYGVPNYLNLFTSEWYRNASRSLYGSGLGDIHQQTIKNTLAVTGTTDFYNRQNCEQFVLHADPAIIAFPNKKPDLTTSDSLITITPFSSVAEDSLDIKARFYNLGRGLRDSIWIELKRQYPDGRQETISKKMIRSVFKTAANRDSISLFTSDSITARVSVKGNFDKGTNYIIATIDPSNEQDEMSEVNNEGKKSFEVSDEEIRPVYPYEFAIVNQTGFTFKGSTANPIQEQRQYRLQLDTTELFNSGALYTTDTVTIGGAVGFKTPTSWKNGTVYYWRLAPVINGQPVNWRYSSFQYLDGVQSGFGQSHYFQHLKSSFKSIHLESTNRKFRFGKNDQNLYIVNCIYGYSGSQDAEFSISTNGIRNMISACSGVSIIFNVFDTTSFKPWLNYDARYNSFPYCGEGREYNFEFRYDKSADRKKMMDFLDSLPKGIIVAARTIINSTGTVAGKPTFDSSFVQYWKQDTLLFGPGKSLYHALRNQGFNDLDSMNRPRTFVFLFKKDDTTNFHPISRLSEGLYDKINMNAFIPTVDTIGQINSPVFGPAKEWKQLSWLGHEEEGSSPSETNLQLIGIGKNGKESVLKTYQPGEWTNDISDVDAAQYPWLKMRMQTKDAEVAIPLQLDYWRLFYTPVADGALSALDYYEFNKPILVTAKDTLKIKLAFKNVSTTWLDSTNVKVVIGSKNGVESTYMLGKLKPLNPNDTAIVSFSKPTDGMDGAYYAYIRVNEEKTPVEQNWFNNFAYLPFEVAAALPLTQVDFTARAEQSAVRINWISTFETDINSYTLEFGSSNANLKAVATFDAINAGSPNESYTWLHQLPTLGLNYYRLKITHQSGAVEYTPIRQVLFENGLTISVYPNPFHDKIKIITGNSSQTTQIDVFNSQGQRVLSKNCAGSCILNTQHLPAGIYTLKASNNRMKTIKLEKH